MNVIIDSALLPDDQGNIIERKRPSRTFLFFSSVKLFEKSHRMPFAFFILWQLLQWFKGCADRLRFSAFNGVFNEYFVGR